MSGYCISRQSQNATFTSPAAKASGDVFFFHLHLSIFRSLLLSYKPSLQTNLHKRINWLLLLFSIFEVNSAKSIFKFIWGIPTAAPINSADGRRAFLLLDSDVIPPEPPLPQAEQSPLSQPLLTSQMFQSLYHVGGPGPSCTEESRTGPSTAGVASPTLSERGCVVSRLAQWGGEAVLSCRHCWGSTAVCTCALSNAQWRVKKNK